MITVKLRSVGNSTGLILPRSALERLHLKSGETSVARLDQQGVLIMKKKTIGTLGKGEKAKEFQYCGSYRDGVVIFFESGEKQIPSELFARALSDHAGKSVDGGFSMTEPTPGGLGEWLERASNKTLRSRHASFMAAILCEEAGVRHRYERNRVLLDFPEGG